MNKDKETRKNRGEPIYLHLTSSLRKRIKEGDFRDIDFPTESELCKEFKVSRFTVREALRLLQSEGLIQRRRGSGTVIHPAAARGGALHQPLSNVAEILQYARDTAFNLKIIGERTLPREVAEQLGLIAGGNWFSFEGIRTQTDTGEIIAFTDVFVSETVTNCIPNIDLTGETIFRQIEKLANLKFKRVTQDIQAILANEKISKSLCIEENDAVLRIIRSYIDSASRVIEISVSYHPGATFAYNMHIEI